MLAGAVFPFDITAIEIKINTIETKNAKILFLFKIYHFQGFFIMLYNFLIIYLVIINLLAIVITALDKSAARKGKWRTSENALMIVSALGGGVAMLATMYVVRHKTKKLKFMIGIPLIILVQLGIAVFILVNL